MKHTLIIFSFLFLFACRKEDPPNSAPDPLDATQIDGHWVDLTGTLDPEWHYHFDGGILTQSYEAFGAQLTSFTYPYAIRNDTIIIGGDLNNEPRRWAVLFECDDVVRVTNQNALINHIFWLKKE